MNNPSDPPTHRLRSGGSPHDLQGLEPLALAAAPQYLGHEKPRSAVATPSESAAKRFGPYLVLERIGEGGMGVVYRAHDPSLGRDVALKLLLPSLLGDPEARARFTQEARAVASFAHDNIVTIHRVGEEEGIPYLVMELLSGMSLVDWLECREQASVPEILHIGRDVARGLAAAHTRGLVHRDIKCGNLWLQTGVDFGSTPPPGFFRVKILDFGLARRLEAPSSLTNQGAILGSPGFIAPEQASGKPVDARTDLFGLGCVLYRLGTGRLPFPGDTLLEALQALAATPPPPARDLNPALPPPLADLVMRLLARDPDERPSSAREVEEILHRLATSPLEAQRAEREPESVRGTVSSAGPALPSLRRGRSWRPVLAGLLVGLVLLASGVSLLVCLAGRPPSVPNENRSGNAEPLPEAVPQLRLTLQRTCVRHTNEIRTLAYSPNGAYLATGSFDQSALIWSVAPLRVMATLRKHKGVVEAVAFSPDSASLVTACSDGKLRRWAVPSGQLLGECQAHRGGAAGLSFGRLATGDSILISGGVDHHVRRWPPDLAKELPWLTVHEANVDTVALSPDGTTIASGSADRTIRLLDARTGEKQGELTGFTDRVSHLAFSSDSQLLAAACADERCVRVWNVARQAEVRPALRLEANVHGVAFSPDGQFLAAGSHRGGGVTVWHLASGQRFGVGQEASWVYAVAFSPDGKSLAVGNYGALEVWRIER